MESSPSLRRQLGVASSTALVVGATIGVGIFLTPGSMAKAAGAPGVLFAVWIGLGLMALAGALCIGELASRFPHAGGSYVYPREAFGPKVAFLYGWKCLIVMDPGLTAALATGVGLYASALWPWVDPRIAAVFAIAVGALANFAGIRWAAGVGQLLGFAKIATLVLVIVVGALVSNGDVSNFAPLWARGADSPPLVVGLASAVAAGFFSFGGWWEAAKLGGEMRDPARTLPRALAFGVLLVTAFYVATSAVFLYLVPLEEVNTAEAFASQVGRSLFGSHGALALSSIVLLSVFGSLLAFMTMVPRLYYAMALDGAAPRWLGTIDPATRAPSRAIALQTVLAVAVTLAGSFDAIVAYFVFATVAFLGLTVYGLFVLRRDLPVALTPVPLFPLTPAVFLAGIAVILALFAMGRPLESALGAGAVAIGLPVYSLFVRRSTP
jgi:basic amino acid/polyamine antiporter, APA family